MFYRTINLVKLNYILKKKSINLILNKNDIKIIRIFLKFNIISMVKKNKKTLNTFTVYFKYLKGEPVFNNIKNLYKPSKPVFIDLKQLYKVNKKKNNIFILSTNKGLLNNFEAEQKKIGGKLIFSLHI